MKIAVVGANGFIGSRVVEQLHFAQEHTVVPIVRSAASIARAARFKGEWRMADARESVALTRALEGCDAVVHAASAQGRDQERMTAALCAAAAAAGTRRIVYLSSATVHGLNPEPGANEHSSLHTTGALPEVSHRIMAERTFFRRCERLQLEGIALRPGKVYGPRCGWFARLAQEMREGRAWWFRDGRGVFNGIYVDNLVSAIFSALAAPPTAAGKPYLIGDEETLTWREFYLATARLLGVAAHRISSVTELPAEVAKSRGGLRRLTGSSGLTAVVPSRVKRLAEFILMPPPPPGIGDAWAPRLQPAPSATWETIQLQQCRWRFPHKRAIRALGFHPPVTFSEGLTRTVSWLSFTEGEPPRTPSVVPPEKTATPAPLEAPPRD